MAFSGTVSTTTVNVAQLMGDAAWLCGKKPSDLTAERVDTAKRQLFYYLMALGNVGVNLWAIEKSIYGVVENARSYDLPAGTIEVLNIQYRRFTRPTGIYFTTAGGDADLAFDGNLDTACVQTSDGGRLFVDYGLNNPIAISCLGFMSYGTQTYDLIYEYSNDAITWTQIYAPGSRSYTDKEWVCSEIMSPVPARFFSVRESGGAALSVREAVFGFNIYDIQLPRQNIDDFNAIPNKDNANRTPPIYWFNRVLTQPQIQIWPPLNYVFDQIVVFRHRQIMDVGDLTNQIEVPDRWLDAVVNNFALRMSMSVFEDVAPDRKADLKQMAMVSLQLASNEERDLSPVSMNFNLSPYSK